MLDAEFKDQPTARLADAIVWSQALFVDATPGDIVTTLMRQAHERGALAEVTADSFGPEVDGAGRPWPSRLTAELAAGTPYWNVLKGLAGRGICTFDLTYPAGDLRLLAVK
jgi:hypothetical protein